MQVCRAEACQARGANGLLAKATEMATGFDVEVDEVFCLGNCALGPSVAVDGRLHGGVDEVALGTIIARRNAARRARRAASRDQ